MTSKASAKASTPSLDLESMVLAYSRRTEAACTSKEPAPATTPLSLRQPDTALSPSLMASFICAMLWSFWPLISTVTDFPYGTSSMNVYFSSPRDTSCTFPASPRSPTSKSLMLLTSRPPHANVSLSMFLRLALRNANIPAFASISRLIGSSPFMFTIIKFLCLASSPSQTLFLSSMILRTLSSVNCRSAETS
jgi:hypothetical protein